MEVEHTDTRKPTANGDPPSCWVATVISLMGYKALLRYEGFGLDGSKDFWVNMGAADVHPVGWSALNGKPLIPPRALCRVRINLCYSRHSQCNLTLNMFSISTEVHQLGAGFGWTTGRRTVPAHRVPRPPDGSLPVSLPRRHDC